MGETKWAEDSMKHAWEAYEEAKNRYDQLHEDLKLAHNDLWEARGELKEAYDEVKEAYQVGCADVEKNAEEEPECAHSYKSAVHAFDERVKFDARSRCLNGATQPLGNKE